MRKITKAAPQVTILQNATDELAATDAELLEWQGHIAAIEGELHKLQERATIRASHKKEATVQLATLRAEQAAAATYQSIATGTHEALSAEKAYRESVAACEEATRELAATNRARALEEKADLVEQAKFQVQLQSSREFLALKMDERQRLLLARDAAHKAHGEQEALALSRGFLALQDQFDGLMEGLQGIERQREQLASQSKERLKEYPELLRDILKQFVPVEDDVTQLLNANIAYRKEVQKHGGELRFFLEDHAIPVYWIQEVVLNERFGGDWQRTIEAVEQKLAAYREEHQP